MATVIPRFRWLLLGYALLVGACMLVQPGSPPRGIVFSHADHGADKGLACITCHANALEGGEASLPGPQLCTVCHQRFDADKPPERQLTAFFDVDGRYLLGRRRHLAPDVAFSHQTHWSAGITCDACHGDMTRNTATPIGPPVGKDGCMKCHAEAGKSNECAECHRDIDRDWLPPTHAAGWDAGHGSASCTRDHGIQDRCEMCHGESSCDACHQEKAPRDHTNHWRRRGHGFAASIDRNRCMTCHRTDGCEQCHQSTPPISHTASFGMPTNRHCAGCHFPLRNDGCATCHRGTPSHALATPLPIGHNPGMNCRLCHGAGAPLPHPDPGTSCIACHN